MKTTLLDQVMEIVARALPQTPQDARRKLQAALAGVFDRLDLVTREELEVQEAVLTRLQQRVRELEAKIASLESEVTQKKS
jgi:ubiquinone biosynthesis accessory factor UbiK